MKSDSLECYLGIKLRKIKEALEEYGDSDTYVVRELLIVEKEAIEEFLQSLHPTEKFHQ